MPTSIFETGKLASEDRPSVTVSLPDNAFEVSTQDPRDGSKKYTFDTIYQDKQLISKAKDYYENLYGIKYRTDEDVVDEFIADRTWKQANITSIASEFIDVKGLDTKQRENLAYLQNYWNELPSFYEEGGRGWVNGIWSNLWRGALDFANIASVGFGALVTKTAGKKAASEVLKKTLQSSAISNAKKKAIQKEIIELQSKIVKPAIIKQTAIATGATVGFDASLFTAADIIAQQSEKDIGLRDKIDLKRAGTVGVIGGGISVLPSGFFSYSAVKEFAKTSQKSTLDPILKQASDNLLTPTKKVKYRTDSETDKTLILTGQSNNKYGNAKYKFTSKVFDQNNFYKLFTETLTGVKQSVKQLKQEYINRKAGDDDPVLKSPYMMMKLLSSSLVRAEDTLKNGVMQLKQVVDPADNRLKLEFVPTKNSLKNGGLEDIVKPFDNVGEGNNFLMYALAKSVKNILEKNKKLPQKKKQANPFNKNEKEAMKIAQRWIDYGEMTPAQYGKKYDITEGSGRKHGVNFKAGLKKLKGFTDDLLELKVSEGLYSREAADKIKAAYPDAYVPMWGMKEAEEVAYVGEKVLTGVGATGKKTRKTIQQIKGKVTLNPLYDSLADYVNFSIKAIDKNRAKKVFYDMLDEYDTKGVIDKNAIASLEKRTTGYNEVITKSAVKDLEKLNIKFEKDAKGNIKGLDDADTTFKTIAFRDSFKKDSGEVIDVVYRDGKPQYYKVNSELMKDTFEFIQNPTLFTRIMGYTRYISRLPAKAITYSPPFVAFNFIRDSVTATVNSAFGFIPILSSVQGFGMTFSGNANGKNMKKYVNAVRQNDEFRKAWVHGLGFTSRAETEWRPNTFVDEIDKYGRTSSNGFLKRNLNYLGANFFSRGVKGYVDLVGRVEYASRFAEYTYAKKAGISSVGAALMGREVSTDFAMKGSSRALQNYSAVTMFFNAGLQGFYRGFRALKENPKKAMAVIGVGIVAPEITLWTLNHNHREYREVPDSVKQLNYLIPMYMREKADGSHLWEDGTRKVEEFVAIPKPYDFGIFANIATGILEGVYTVSPGVATQYIMNSFSIMMPGLQTPTLLNPWVAMYTNTNWQGDPIKPTGFSRKIDRLQYKSNTRESIIQFTQFLEKITGDGGLALRGDGKLGVTISPITLDYMVNAYFTGLASYPLDLLDARLWDDVQFGELPKERGDRADLARQPWSIITRKFTVKTPVKNSKNIKKFYDIKNRADAIKDLKNVTTTDLREVLNIKEFSESQEVKDYLGISSFLSMIAEKLAESRNVRNDIKFMKFLPGTKTVYSAELKRQHIDELIAQENAIAFKAIQQIKKANFDTIETDIFGKTYNPINVKSDDKPVTLSRQMQEILK